MINYLIIFLAVLLLFLFVDWTSILENSRQKRTERRLKKQSAPKSFEVPKTSPKIIEKTPELAKPNLKTEQAENPAFNFEPEGEELREMEMVIPEEKEPEQVYTKEIEEILGKADVHFRKGEMKASEKLYIQAAAKNPQCSKAYSRLGVIYLENGDNWQDAEEAFRQALKYDPQNGYILNNLGLVLYHQDKYAHAIRHFEQAVRQDELNAARHANLGMGYMAIRQYAKAESSFKKALKLAPAEIEYKDLLNESIEKKKAHKTMVRR